MKKTLLFGAGQVGKLCATLLGGDYESLCFADNFPGKWGSKLLGLKVLNPADALALKPDCVCLCVTDAQRSAEMREQLASLGYAGEIITPELLKAFDSRSAVMRLMAQEMNALGVEGAAAELGVFRGDFASQINAAFPERQLLLFDTFEGFAAADVEIEQAQGFSCAREGDFADTGVELVRSKLPHPERAEFYKGFFPDSFAPCMERRFAFVSLDADLYAPTAAALPIFYDRLSPGGAIILHDVNSTQYSGAGKALREFCRERALVFVPLPDLHGSAVLVKNLK